MSKPLIVFGFAAVLNLFPVDAFAEDLQKQPATLARILGTMRILAERERPLARVISVDESKECDPHNEARTCPHGQLLISISDDYLGMPVSSVVWSTPRRIGWKFIRWLDTAESPPSIRFEATACEAHPDVEAGRVDPRKGGWWKTVRYEINANQKRAILKRLDGPDANCDLY